MTGGDRHPEGVVRVLHLGEVEAGDGQFAPDVGGVAGDRVDEVVQREATDDGVAEVVGHAIERTLASELFVQLAVVGGEVGHEVVVDDEGPVGVAEGARLALDEVVEGQRLGQVPFGQVLDGAGLCPEEFEVLLDRPLGRHVPPPVEHAHDVGLERIVHVAQEELGELSVDDGLVGVGLGDRHGMSSEYVVQDS